MYFTPGRENAGANPLSVFPKIGNQKDTQNPNYKMEITPNNYYIDELPEGMFPKTFKIIYRYQWKYPVLISKHECAKYKTGFPWRQEYNPNFSMRGLNSHSMEIYQIYVVHWYHIYILRFGLDIMKAMAL